MGAPAGDPMLGRVIAGRFTVLARLGAGAMGTVYRAKQARIGREVAIKILRSDRALDEASRGRFLREARANSLLTSPNTVTVFDFGADDNGDFYLAMELLEGESLGQRIRRQGRLDAASAVETALQALRSLAEAHAKGIIHRDLKPDNLFYARSYSGNRTQAPGDEIVKVLDFGVAKMMHADAELAMSAIETQAGTVFGTPRYMSPEQAQGRALDTRSDLYSLGVILYQMLTGRPPFTDDDAVVVMARHIKTPPRPMSEVAPEAAVPAELEAVVMKALSKDPDQRPPNADAMALELGQALELAGPAASPVSSGIRPSIPAEPLFAPQALEDDRAAPVAPVVAGSPSAAIGDGSDVAAQVAALRPKRWPLVVALAATAALVTGIISSEWSSTRDLPARAHQATEVPSPASAPDGVADRSVSTSTTSAVSIANASASSQALPSVATSPVAASAAAAPVPKVPPSSVKHAGGRPNAATPHAAAGAGPPVGYGYLE